MRKLYADAGGGWRQLPSGQSEELTEIYSTLAEMAANPGYPDQVVYCKGRTSVGDGFQGHFYWSTANHSTDVTKDPQQGIYIAPTSDTTGASGAWVRQYHANAVWVEWFLPAGFTVSTDDATSYFEAAKTVLTNGGTIKFSSPYLLNYVHTGDNYVFKGENAILYKNSSISLNSYDSTKYAFELGDGSTETYNTNFHNVAFYGNNTNQYGFNINGAFGGNFFNLSVRGYTAENLHITSTSTRPSTYLNFFGGFITAGFNASGNAFHAENGGSYVTATNFIGTQFSYTSPCNKTIVIDGCPIGFTDSYIQVANGYGVSLLNDGKIYGKNTIIDAGGGTNVAVNIDIASTSGTYINTWLRGSIDVIGTIEFSDAVAVNGGYGQFINDEAFLSDPAISGNLYLAKSGTTLAQQTPDQLSNYARILVDSTGSIQYNTTGSLAGGGHEFYTPSGQSILFRAASGTTTLEIGQSAALAYIQATSTGDLYFIPSGAQASHIQKNVILADSTSRTIGFYGVTGAVQQSITGALSAVTDANAKAVLTSIIAALTATNYAVDGTT